MGYLNREIEVKTRVDGLKSYQTAVDFVRSALESSVTEEEVSTATDLYWNAPKSGIKADFLRLRKIAGGGQITAKCTDRGNNIDRVEIDLEVSDRAQAKELITALLGEPIAKVTKKYTVFFLENQFTNVSVYQVTGDKKVFVEIEAKSKSRLKEITKALMKASDKDWSWFWVRSSVYQMFVKKEDMVEKPIEEFFQNVK